MICNVLALGKKKILRMLVAIGLSYDHLFGKRVMVSCEPHRKSAYSEDLRWRMVWQVEGLGYSQKKVAQNLGVDYSTVSRTISLFLTTGSVSKKEYPKEKACRSLTIPAQMFILNLIVSRPGIYLREIQKELVDLLEIEIDTSTVCRFLHDSGCTHQKLCLVASQRDTVLRQKYILEVSVYKPEMFIFLDETGADNRDIVRRYGYSLRGMPLKKQTPLVRGERSSAVAIMSTCGILDVCITKGTTNGDTFCNFIQRHLLPFLEPFNGHSVVVMDNCSIHHVQEIAEVIEEVGALLHFLPPYSPDLNPIELAFSKVKSGIKDSESSLPNSDTDTMILAAFASITRQDCQNWIAHSGIYYT